MAVRRLESAILQVQPGLVPGWPSLLTLRVEVSIAQRA